VPRLTEFSSENEWVEPDDVPRPVVTYGIASAGFGDVELEPHHHAKSQILLVHRGALSCEVEGGLWIVPPRSALWIPGGARHSIKVTGSLEGYGAFVAGDAEPGLPSTCRTVSVTPLLRDCLFARRTCRSCTTIAGRPRALWRSCWMRFRQHGWRISICRCQPIPGCASSLMQCWPTPPIEPRSTSGRTRPM